MPTTRNRQETTHASRGDGNLPHATNVKKSVSVGNHPTLERGRKPLKFWNLYFWRFCRKPIIPRQGTETNQTPSQSRLFQAQETTQPSRGDGNYTPGFKLAQKFNSRPPPNPRQGPETKQIQFLYSTQIRVGNHPILERGRKLVYIIFHNYLPLFVGPHPTLKRYRKPCVSNSFNIHFLAMQETTQPSRGAGNSLTAFVSLVLYQVGPHPYLERGRKQLFEQCFLDRTP